MNPRSPEFEAKLAATIAKPKEASAPSPQHPSETAPAADTGNQAQEEPEYKAKTAARIDQLLGQRREAYAQVEQLQAKLAHLEAQRAAPPQPKAPERPKRPNQGDFADYDAYEAALDAYQEALAEWKAEEKFKGHREGLERRAVEMEAETRQRREVNHFAQLHAAAVKEMPGFEEASQAAYQIIQRSGNTAFNYLPDLGSTGNKVLYELGRNEAECERIASLPPHEALAELVRLQDRISAVAPARKLVTDAPPPPTELGGVKTTPADPERTAVATGDVGAMIRLERERMSKR